MGEYDQIIREHVEMGRDIDAVAVADILAERDALLTLVHLAMHLVEYGERAPGGDETWRGWYERAERHLRCNEGAA